MLACYSLASKEGRRRVKDPPQPTYNFWEKPKEEDHEDDEDDCDDDWRKDGEKGADERDSVFHD